MRLDRGSRQLDDPHQHRGENRPGASCQRHAPNLKHMLHDLMSRRGREFVLRSTARAQRPTVVIG
jgi:hypothetical protein